MNHLQGFGGSSHYNPLSVPYNYKYNGKELQETGMYDYGWRMYMPDIARWNGMDQLAESYNPYSPYTYVMNNPVMFTDPDGRDKKPSGNWLQDMWDATDSYSYWTNTGNGYFTGGEKDGGISHEEFTNFYNFLAGGGTGMYSYWTGGAMPTGGSIVGNDGLKQRDIQELVGHAINIKGSDNNWMDTFGKWNAGAGFGATGIEQIEGSFRLGTTMRGFSPKYYGNAWTGNQYAKTFNIGKIGKGLGEFGFYAGVIVDGVGVYNYVNDSNSPNAVHPAKAGLNTGMGLLGMYGGPIGALLAGVYTGVDVFYPGGWVGASETAARTEAHEQATTGHPFFSNSALKF